MMIVVAFPVSVESLLENPSLLPSVDELRPKSCPECGAVAFECEKRFQIVGHGTFRRQVLGLTEPTHEGVIVVRRYLCRACKRTISVLPDALYPHRWYAATAMLVGLFLHLMCGVSADHVRRRLSPSSQASGGWKTLRRWRRQLLAPLWFWFQKQLGFCGPARTRDDGVKRLRRLLAHEGVGDTSDEISVARSAHELSRGSVYSARLRGGIGRDPPDNRREISPDRARSTPSTEEDRRTRSREQPS